MCFTLLLQMRRRLIAWLWRTGRLGSYGEGSVQMRRRNTTLWPKKRVLLVLATVEIGRLHVSKILSNMNANVSFVSRWRSRVGALLATEPQSIPLYSEHTFMRAFITCSANGLRSVEFYVLCYGPNHYAVGTQCGVQYLQSHANIPMDFLHSHKGTVYTIQECSPLAYIKSRIYIWV